MDCCLIRADEEAGISHLIGILTHMLIEPAIEPTVVHFIGSREVSGGGGIVLLIVGVEDLAICERRRGTALDVGDDKSITPVITSIPISNTSITYSDQLHAVEVGVGKTLGIPIDSEPALTWTKVMGLTIHAHLDHTAIHESADHDRITVLYTGGDTLGGIGKGNCTLGSNKSAVLNDLTILEGNYEELIEAIEDKSNTRLATEDIAGNAYGTSGIGILILTHKHRVVLKILRKNLGRRAINSILPDPYFERVIGDPPILD